MSQSSRAGGACSHAGSAGSQLDAGKSEAHQQRRLGPWRRLVWPGLAAARGPGVRHAGRLTGWQAFEGKLVTNDVLVRRSTAFPFSPKEALPKREEWLAWKLMHTQPLGSLPCCQMRRGAAAAEAAVRRLRRLPPCADGRSNSSFSASSEGLQRPPPRPPRTMQADTLQRRARPPPQPLKQATAVEQEGGEAPELPSPAIREQPTAQLPPPWPSLLPPVPAGVAPSDAPPRRRPPPTGAQRREARAIKSLRDTLATYRIALPAYSDNEYRIECPKCSGGSARAAWSERLPGG